MNENELDVLEMQEEFAGNPVENESRKLVEVTTIKSVSSIEGADRIELVTFTTNFWQCVAGKGEFIELQVKNRIKV